MNISVRAHRLEMEQSGGSTVPEIRSLHQTGVLGLR